MIGRHGRYRDVAGWFAISSDGSPAPRQDVAVTDSGAMRLAVANPGNQTAAAYSLCALGRANGIDCAVLPQPGRHDWPFAGRAFAAALPWLAGRLGTPGTPRTALPPASPPPPSPARVVVPAQRSNGAGK